MGNTPSTEEQSEHFKKKRNSAIFEELLDHLNELQDKIWRKCIHQTRIIYSNDIDKVTEAVTIGEKLANDIDFATYFVQLMLQSDISEQCFELALDIAILHGFNVNENINYYGDPYPPPILFNLVVRKHHKYKPYYLDDPIYPSILFNYKWFKESSKENTPNDFSICDSFSYEILNKTDIYGVSLLTRLYRDMKASCHDDDNLIKLIYKLMSKIHPDGSGVIIPCSLRIEIKEAHKMCRDTINELRTLYAGYTYTGYTYVFKEYIIDDLYRHTLLYESFKPLFYKELSFLGKDITSVVYSYTVHAEQNKELLATVMMQC